MKQVINDEKRELHLCIDCASAEASETGVSWPGPSFHQLLGGLLGSEGAWGRLEGSGGGVRCPNCSLSFADFQRLGHFGCGQCYETFAEPLEPVLRRIQSGTTHTGKVPARAAGALKLRRERQRLERELQDLVTREEYEQAAVVRDRLRAMVRAATNGRTDGDAVDGRGVAAGENEQADEQV